MFLSPLLPRYCTATAGCCHHTIAATLLPYSPLLPHSPPLPPNYHAACRHRAKPTPCCHCRCHAAVTVADRRVAVPLLPLSCCCHHCHAAATSAAVLPTPSATTAAAAAAATAVAFIFCHRFFHQQCFTAALLLVMPLRCLPTWLRQQSKGSFLRHGEAAKNWKDEGMAAKFGCCGISEVF